MQSPDKTAPKAEKSVIPKRISDWLAREFLVTNDAKITASRGDVLDIGVPDPVNLKDL